MSSNVAPLKGFRMRASTTKLPASTYWFGISFGIAITVLSVEQPRLAAAQDKATDASLERVLKGDDAKAVRALEKKIGELRHAGQFQAAQELAAKILDICMRVQGADHWQTA